MVTTLLREYLPPVALFAFTTLVFGTCQIMMGIAIVGLLFTEVSAVKSLFSNNRKSTSCNPETEEEKAWVSEISSRISGILKTPVEGAERDNQFAEKRSNLPERAKENQESF